MSEWSSVLAVFWVLWALDGARLAPRRIFTFVIGLCPPWRTRVVYSRLSLPGVLPASGGATAADVPLSFAPDGVCNRPAGSTGRPAEAPVQAQAWRWEDVREVGVARGWIFVNGVRFFPDTGHVKAPELLELARLSPGAREAKIVTLIQRWLRPAHLRRRAKVLAGRTVAPAMLNTISFAGWLALTIYVVGDIASKLPTRWSELLAEALPGIVFTLAVLHVGAVMIAWRVVRRLKPVTLQKRGSALFSALLLPPQALRLRALAGEGFYPVQHPLAVALAFTRGERGKTYVFTTLADLRWPIDDADDPPLAREITGWYRRALEARLTPLLQDAGLAPDALLAPPVSNAPASCSYCPRCRDQFVDGRACCPNGVPLRPLAGR